MLCTTNYSALQQEKLYILETLAREEGKGERLATALEKLQQKLRDTERLKELGKSVSVKKLKHSIRGLTFNMGRSQKTIQPLVHNLMLVNSQILSLEQYQWRLTAAEYRRQSLFGTLMSPLDSTRPPMIPEAELRDQDPHVPNAEVAYHSRFQCLTPLDSPFTPRTLATSLMWSQINSPGDPYERRQDVDSMGPVPTSTHHSHASPQPQLLTDVEAALLSPSSLANWSIEEGFDEDLVIAVPKEMESRMGQQSRHAVKTLAVADTHIKLRPQRRSSISILEEACCKTRGSTNVRRRASLTDGTSAG